MVSKCVDCEGLVIPYKEDITKLYNGTRLTMKNFPVRKCVLCGQSTYGTGSMIKYLNIAIKHFENTGETTITL